MAQNLKENILDAYTIVEHLGEGDIDKRDKKLKPLGTLDFELPDQKDYQQYV